MLAQEPVAEAVVEKLKRRLNTLRVGDPLDKNTDLGAINSAPQLEKIRSLVESGVEEGANLYQPDCLLPEKGLFFRPSLFTEVSQSHRIAREEIFGPVLSVLTFRTPEEAVEKSWAARTACNRGRILYRIAEMMDSRKDEFIREVCACAPFADSDSDANSGQQAVCEVETAIDRWIWYAGWCDKFASLAGSSNPVAGPYFGFTIPEPTGVVGIVAPDKAPLASLVSRLAPVLVSGNTSVVLASERHPLPAIALAEVLATSDVPSGVVNILTGRRKKLIPPLASHGDVDALDLTGCDTELQAEARLSAAATVTRVVTATTSERHWLTASAESPYIIEAFCEYKTVWHPKGA